MKENRYDPLKRTDLTENEQLALRFMAARLHGYNFDLIDECVAEDYIGIRNQEFNKISYRGTKSNKNIS